MSSCPPGLKRPCMMNRWGEGSGCAVKPPNTAAAKEAEAKVAAMIQERQRQDTELWGPPAEKNPQKK